MENLLKQIEELRESFLETRKLLDIDKSKARADSLKLQMNEPDFWEDREAAVQIAKEAENLEKEVEKWETMGGEIRELEEFVAFAQKDALDREADIDEKLADEMHKKYSELKDKFSELEFFVFFSGEYDRYNAVLSIHAGTGGVDAQDWASMLERMLLRFAEKKHWKVTTLNRTMGQEAGIKSSMIKIEGLWVYGNLKSENGVHRLVRISPFDAESMRHTSFALVEVIPELPEAENMEIKDQDLRIDVFRSSGPGGQGVNTTDSAVRLVHIPTGITVTCQSERSQHQNRETALKILKSKLFKINIEEKKSQEQKLRGELQKAEWGKQIRSYVLQPYKMAKDHRTDFETQDVEGVLEGHLEGFIEAYLRKIKE
jgi:peptide chain release factor 2